MAESLTAQVTLTVGWKHSAPEGLGTGRSDGAISKNFAFVNGTGAAALEINEIYNAQRTLLGAATEDLDLAGVLDNAFRTGITFNRIKVLMIVLDDAVAPAVQASSIKVGGAAAAGFISPFGDSTDKLVVLKGGFLLLLASSISAYPVVATTADKLKIENVDAVITATYKIVILGTKP